MPQIRREYKDRLFTYIFGNPDHREWTLSLYNAVNDTSHANPADIEFNTIEDVLFLSMHNDVSFIIADEMNMCEQQSTYNPNMPLRMLQYASSLYERHVQASGANKYGSVKIHLPTPKPLVFYNGRRDAPVEQTLLLSDSFSVGQDADIEVRVRMININETHNPSLMEACKPLREYAWTVERIRERIETYGRKADRTRIIGEIIEEMPADFVLRPYLMAHKAEVVDMLLTEYNEAEAMELFRKEGEALGEARGEARGVRGMVRMCQSFELSFDDTVQRVAEALEISPAQAQSRVAPFWE